MNLTALFYSKKNLDPTRLIVSGFAVVILVGALLLHLPVSARDGQWSSWLTCLFTATSATCVTGLVQVDTFLYWSPFGQAVVLLLIQLGGLGFVTLLSLISILVGQRIGLSQRMAMASSLNLPNVGGVVGVVRLALRGTFLVEGIGAIVLATRFVPLFGWGRGLWFSLFHSISAFCNGGFDLMGGYSGPFSSLCAFQDDPVVLLTIIALIVLGGLGFYVWEELLRVRSWKALSLYSKLVLEITAGLILLGMAMTLIIEWDNPATLGDMTAGEKLLNALFQSVTLRTAGYCTIDQGMLQDGSAVFSALLMLVGGSSGSTAGGIKTVTVGVLLLTAWSSLRGREQVVFRGRTIPARKVLDAVTLTVAVGMLLVFGSMALSVLDGVPMLEAVYETASALGTVGLSMGVTPALSAGSSVLVIAYMFLGRVGILSFSIAFLIRRTESKLRYPNAQVLIG